MKIVTDLSITSRSLRLGGGFSPASIFAQGVVGAYHGVAGPGEVFADAAGAIPAGIGQGAARVADLSGNGHAAVQTGAALRPVPGRAPAAGRRNLLEQTEALNAAYWSATGITATQVGGEAWRLAATGDGGKFVRRAGVVGASTPFLWSVELKADSVDRARLTVRPEGTDPFIDLNLTAGTIVAQAYGAGGGSVPGGSAAIQPVGDGWFRVTMFAPMGRSGSSPDPGIAVLNAAGQFGYAAAGEAILMRRPQFEAYRADGPTPYQHVGAAIDVTEAGVPSHAFLRFDLIDDALSTVLPAGGVLDVMAFGRLGSWIGRGIVVAPGGVLGIGPATITGGPAGLMAALGDIVGWLAVDRRLTDAEVARLVRYHQARGAGALIGLGQAITGIAPALIGPYQAGDAPTGAYAPGSYASGAGGIAGIAPAWTVNGAAMDGATALAGGDQVRLRETVTDTAVPPNSRVFDYGPASVTAAVPPDPEPVPDPSAAWTLDGAVHAGSSPVLAGSEMRTVEFSADGNRMYAVFRGTQVVRQFNLGAPYDVTTAAPAGNGDHAFAGYITTGTRGDSVAHGFFIRKGTGTTAWLVNRTEVWVLTLATPWDITTATPTGYMFLGAGNATGHVLQRAHDLDWRTDGTQWFIEDRDAGRVFRFAVATPWDITTSVAAGSYVIPNVDEVRGIELQRDGTQMFLMHTAARQAREYALAAPWDVATASLTRSFGVAGQSNDPKSLTFRPDGGAFFVGDASVRRVHVYDAGAPPPPPPPPPPGHDFDVATAEGGVTVEWAGVPVDFSITSAEGGVTIEWDD